MDSYYILNDVTSSHESYREDVGSRLEGQLAV